MAAKGMVEVIFWLAIIFIVLMVAWRFMSSFVEASPGPQAQNDLKGLIEDVCSADGPSTSSISLYLPKTDDVSGNPKFQKLRMTKDGALNFYKCASTGASCTGDGLQKSKVLNCPSDVTFTDCWVAPSLESVSVIVVKDFNKKISFSKSTEDGVTCT